ncbi:MAG: hypothetical protein ACTSWY_04890 [Promethearchaeota archaeon]
MINTQKVGKKTRKSFNNGCNCENWRFGGLGTIRLWKNKFNLAKGLVKSKEEKISEEQATLSNRKAMSEESLREEYRRDAIAAFAAYEGDVANGYVLIGQSIGIINSVESVEDIIEMIVKDAEIALKRASSLIQ